MTGKQIAERRRTITVQSDEHRHRPHASTATLVLVAQTDISREIREGAATDWLISLTFIGAWLGLSAFTCGLIRLRLRPLHELAAQTTTIQPDKPGTRIHLHSGSNEIDQLTTAMNALLARMEDSLTRERQFAAHAAHELRTPLAQVRADLEINLRRPRDTAEYQQTLTACHTDVLRLESLITALLDWSRAQGPAINGLLPITEMLAFFKHQHLDLQISRRTDDTNESIEDVRSLAIPPVFFNIIIDNILTNAQRYAPGSPITGQLTWSDQACIITINDNGPGIPEADHERIFAPLVRLDAARSISATTQTGFGLGLSIARQMAQRSGGNLQCQSRPDGMTGASFALTLPFASDQLDQQPQPDQDSFSA